jgi:xanthine dehydrogenase molybdenum-binding subunit
MGDSRVVGQSIPRIESSEKVTGRGRYTTDVELPRMVYARLARTPYPHARIVRVDTTAALALPGVLLVLSSADIASYFPSLPAYDPVEGPPAGGVDRAGDQRLFDSRVRFAGEAVAMVVAGSDAVARKAVSLLEVEYDELRAVLDPESALAEGGVLVHDGAARNVARQFEQRIGTVEHAFARAALVLERRFVTPRQKQAQLEPTCCVAELDASGRLSVWSAHQSPYRLRDILANIFRFPRAKVRVVTPLIGGAFGKADALTAEPYAVAAALVTRRPVKLRFSRQDDFVGTDARHPTVTNLTVGFHADGTIAALRGRTVVDAGAYLGHSAGVASVLVRQFLAPYRIAHADIEATVVYTNTPVTGAFRGYGGPQACFPLEHTIDLAAHELGVDPLEARKKMRIRVGDNWRGLGPIISDGLGESLDRGAAAIGWQERQRQGPVAQGRIRRGVGAACTVWGSGAAGNAGILDYSSADIRINTDGTVTLACGGCDLGTGLRTALAQICAEELGVPFDAVYLTDADTDLAPYDTGAHASRSLYRNGQAVQTASATLRRDVLEYAAASKECAVDDLQLHDGRVTVKGSPGSSVDLAWLARRALHDNRVFRASAGTELANAPTFISQFAEVDVDLDTGVVRVQRLITAQDVGRAINPNIVVGQIQGAAHQGLGYALTETLVLDADTGSLLNGTYMDYRLLTSMDAPPSEVILIEHPHPSGPFGAKGMAELGIIPTAAAVANAILHATGASLTELPMTPARVHAALRASPGV